MVKKAVFLSGILSLVLASSQILAQNDNCCCTDCSVLSSIQAQLLNPPSATFVSLYSLQPQTIGPGQSATFEAVNAATSGFDISSAASTGAITVSQHGYYLISWEVVGSVSPPYPMRGHVWTFGIFRNGQLLPGTVSAAVATENLEVIPNTLAPAFIEFFAGDTLALVNTTNVNINAKSNALGAIVPFGSARITLSQAAVLP